MTAQDIYEIATKSFVAYGKALYNDGLHMAMTVGRGLSVKGRKKEFQGAMYSAILDHRVCDYCESLDGLKIRLDHPDFKSGKYNPPQHKNCRCVWIYIHNDEPNVRYNWDKYKKKGSAKSEAQYHSNPVVTKLQEAIEKLKSSESVTKLRKAFNV